MMSTPKTYRPSTLASAIDSVREDLDRVAGDLTTSLRWVMSTQVDSAVTHAIERLAIHAESLRVIAAGCRAIPEVIPPVGGRRSADITPVRQKG